jgi:hypothetical protein
MSKGHFSKANRKNTTCTTIQDTNEYLKVHVIIKSYKKILNK